VSFKETKFYNGAIFNLGVQAPHSYVSDSVCLHNCGDIMTIYIKVNDNIITDIRFETFGCGAAIATSSMVTELVKGKTIEEALKITNRTVAEALDGLPPIKMHCSLLAEDGVKAAIADYKKRQNFKKEEVKGVEIKRKTEVIH
jgi:nitrogen fixation NifU-like protein